MFFFFLELFSDGNDFSYETIENNRNIYYQKKTANEISNEFNKIILLIISSLNIHLNQNQSLTINTSSIIIILEKISINSISNKLFKLIEKAQFNISSNFNLNQFVLFQV